MDFKDMPGTHKLIALANRQIECGEIEPGACL